MFNLKNDFAENKENVKFFVIRVLYLLLPSIYLLVRMQIVSVQSIDINILGQMEWFDLIDEILATALSVPLYSLLKEKNNKDFSGFSILIAFAIYMIFAIIVYFNVQNITAYMQAENANEYLRLQTVSMLIGFVSTLAVLILTLHTDNKGFTYIIQPYSPTPLFTLHTDNKGFTWLLLIKLGSQIVLDYLLIPKYQVLGSSYSEIITNVIVSFTTVFVAVKHGYLKWNFPSFVYIKEWVWKILCSGAQIFLDNFIYAVMVCKMVNAVSESGNYWVANNFIWG